MLPEDHPLPPLEGPGHIIRPVCRTNLSLDADPVDDASELFQRLFMDISAPREILVFTQAGRGIYFTS